MKAQIFILFILVSFCSVAQTKKLKFWFGNDSAKGLEKVVEVKASDTTIMEGEYLHFYQSGEVRLKGDFYFNKPVGLWTYFYEAGDVKQTINYKTDSTSYWIYYFENGVKKKEGQVRNYLRDSIWTYYYEKGSVLKKGSYVSDYQDGKWDYFFEDGESKAMAMYDMGTGNYTEYHYNGTVKMTGPVMNNVSNGVCSYFYESGKLKAKGFETSGVKDGYWKYYYENDSLASKGNYLNGSKKGDWFFYHKNGELSSEGLMTEGVRDGYWKLYNENGGFKADATLLNGTGSYKEYYDNNHLKVDGFLKDDKNHGVWSYYYEDGILEAKAEFEEGVGEYIGYYNSGEMKMKGTIKDGKQVGTWELYDKDGSVIGYYKLVESSKGDVSQVEIPTTDNNPPILPTDTVVSHDLPRFVKAHKQKYRPFQAKNRESKGIIIGGNPVAFIANQIPVSVEFFIQERLGHEFRYTLNRAPFFLSNKNIPDSVLYKRGYSLDLKQKFYSKYKDSRGMLYFGHELRFGKDSYFVKTDNGSALNELNQTKIEYAWTIGDRVIRSLREGGLTFDIYLGLGVAYVIQKKDIATEIEQYYLNVSSDKIQLNPRVGFTIGYLF